MEQAFLGILLLCSLPFWLLVGGFIWFVRRYVSESKNLKFLLNKLSSEASGTSQETTVTDVSRLEVSDIENSRPSLTITVEDTSTAPPVDDTAFQTPVGNDNLHSPANLEDVSDFIHQLDDSSLEDSGMTKLSLPRELDEEKDGNDPFWKVEKVTACEKNRTIGFKRRSIAGTVPVFPELTYDVVLMSFTPGELGRGGFGRVREAMYKDQNGEVHHVAAKYPHEHFQDAALTLKSELEMISKVPIHPNVVKYFGGHIPLKDSSHVKAQDIFIMMELMHTNLEHVIHGESFQNGLSLCLILSISLDIVNGLHHLHEYGIIHYDLKPSNVLLNEELRAKLADFGSSKRKLNSHITASLRGTIGYIAPEIMFSNFTGRMHVSEKLDIYSLGMVMWEMVTGERPPDLREQTSSFAEFSNDSLKSLEEIFCIENLKPTGMEHCPDILRSLIEDCLKMEPTERPSTKEVKARLLGINETFF